MEAESLLAALAALPNDQKATFLLYHVEEQPIAHIAAALKVPEGTVKSRLYAARQRLRALLGEETNYVIEPCES